MRKIFMCALLAFVLTGPQSQALPRSLDVTVGVFAAAIRKLSPKITDEQIYKKYNTEIEGKFKTWDDFAKKPPSGYYGLLTAIDNLSWGAASATKEEDVKKYKEYIANKK
jgi:hypothetical protein